MGIPTNIFEQLFAHSMRLDVQSFRFTHRDSPTTLILSGYGYFEYLTTDDINFTLYFFPEAGEILIDETIGRYSTNKSDFIIQILDINGCKWEIILGDIKLHHNDATDAISYITGDCDSLIHKSASHHKDNKYYIYLNIDSKYNIPFNSSDRRSTTTSKGRLIGYKATPEVEYDGNSINLRGGKYGKHISLRFSFNSYVENVEYRLLECLRFITGQKIEYTLIEKHFNARCTSIIKPLPCDPLGSIQPPIRVHEYPSEQANYSWLLCDLMYEFIKDITSRYFSPIGTHANAVIGSGPAYFETKSLILSVHIEGLIRDFLMNIVKMPKEMTKKINLYMEGISRIEPGSTVEKRLLGTCADMLSHSPHQVITVLIDMKVLIKRHQKTWTKIRNKYAHPGIKGRKNDHSCLYDSYYIILEMYYLLIFHILGYRGKYSDFKKGGNSLKTFPRPNPSTSA